MNVPVHISLRNAVDEVSTVMDDELHQLVLEGQVSFKDAIKALKDAGLALDKRFYPWLQYVENLATGEFDKKPPVIVPDDKPELLSEKAENAVEAKDFGKDADPGPAPDPHAVQGDTNPTVNNVPVNPELAKSVEDPKPEPETNPEGAD